MDCRHVRDIADSFLAEALLTETNHEILRHLETCPGCRDDFAARRAVRDAVRRAVLNSRALEPRPEFVAALRTRLQNAAVEVPTRRGFRFHAWWAVAAAVLLAVAVGAMYRGRDWIMATGALARAAVGDHRNCALQFRLTEKPISLEEAARRYGVAYGVLDKLPPNGVATAAGPARVLERHACVFNGRRFAHIVLEYRDRQISLLVTDLDAHVPFAQPRGAQADVTSAGRVDGMSVVFFRTPRYMVFFTGDVEPTDLVSLAEAVAQPLYRELAGA